MIKSSETLNILLDRNDYSELFKELNVRGYGDTDLARLLDSLRYSVNFDFKASKRRLSKASGDYFRKKEVKKYDGNLTALIGGMPSALFSELIESLKLQMEDEKYIDFIGRVYRLREAIFKFMFVSKTIGKTEFFMTSPAIGRKYILKTLRKKHRIFNSNLVFGITAYFNKNYKEKKYMDVIRILNSDKMSRLIDLRNESIAGHGFVGISIDDIMEIYASPRNILEDFDKCMELLEISVVTNKYIDINKFIRTELETMIAE